MPPAWYADPAAAGWLRWWDGYAWTAAVRPAMRVGVGWPGRAAAEHDLAEEAKSARQAGSAVLAGVVAYIGLYVFSAISAHNAVKQFRAVFDYDGTGPVPSSSYATSGPWNYLIELVLILAGVTFMIWLRRAAVLAGQAGLPASRAPVWAVLGFIVPVVNLWFPYQVARDLFPPGHPGRRLVGRWWALWLTTSFAGLVVYVVALFSVPAAGLAIAVAAGFAVWAGLAARTMIAACGPAHATLLGH